MLITGLITDQHLLQCIYFTDAVRHRFDCFSSLGVFVLGFFFRGFSFLFFGVAAERRGRESHSGEEYLPGGAAHHQTRGFNE